MGDVRIPKNFGGVIIDENQVKFKRIEPGLNGNDTYVIEFKSGVIARYKKQSLGQVAALNSSRSPFNYKSKDKVMFTEGWNIKGLTIEGSDVRDDMMFHDCEDTNVLNYNDSIKDSCTFYRGKNNSHFDK